MALKLTPQQIQKRFPDNTICDVSYMGKSKRIRQTLKAVNWNARPQAITLMFTKPKSYMIDGDEAIRPGVRVEIITK